MASRVFVALCIATFSVANGSAHAVTDEQVNRAIVRMQQFFFDRQGPEGDWEQQYAQNHGGGETALVTLALLASGQSHQGPRIQEALRYLADKQIDSTYALSVRAHVWAALPEGFRPQLVKDAQQLHEAHRNSIFQYDLRPPGRGAVDHSCTQYGVLGLWEFAKRRGRSPQRFWDDAIKHFLQWQNPDGGWAYRPASGSSGSMTAAGLTVLYVGLQERYRGYNRAPRAVMKSIERGLDWLDRHYTPERNPFGLPFVYYYLYGIERVALAGGVKQLNGVDWFASGAARIVADEDGSGSIHGGNHADTAFALLFLARGRVPVWINKIEVPGAAWNNRPNDLYFLTQHLSDTGEQELNWQVVDIDTDPADWLNASIAWFATDAAIELTAAQKSNLKAYLDLGGLLLVNPDMNTTRLLPAVRQLARELYPQYPMGSLPADHVLLEGRSMAPMQGVHNGVRDLILMPQRDWGLAFQRDKPPGVGVEWTTIEAIVAMVYENRRDGHRLAHPFEMRKQRDATGIVHVSRAQYDGNWNCEPRSWEPLEAHLFNATGKQLAIHELPLDQIASADVSLVHLSGVDSFTIRQSELEAIGRFVAGGGTVLVETIGGKGDFSVGVQQQLGEYLEQVSVPLEDSPIVTGDRIEGFDNRRVVYRAYSVINFGLRHRPALAAFMQGERPAIIISHEDLSLGALGVRHRDINGYRAASARNLLSNIVLFAAGGNGAAPEGPGGR